MCTIWRIYRLLTPLPQPISLTKIITKIKINIRLFVIFDYQFEKKEGGNFMKCPRCRSENVTVQVINEVELKNKHHGFFWWLFIGWWWTAFKWIFLTMPALIFLIFGHKKQKAVNHKHKVCVCQNCGHSWKK